MNESLKVSVILAVYNGEQFVRESIESVLNQTHSNIQLIIINDGSTDQTDKIIREIKDDRIEIVTLPENRHISYATNVGMEKATGDYLAIIDSDDRWRNDKLEIQLEYLQAHPEHEGCFSWVDLIDKNGDVVNDRYLGIYKLFACQTETRKAWLRFFFFKGNRLSNPSSIVSMKAAKAVGKHDRFYIQAQDMDWWVRFTKKFSFGVIEETLTQMRMREGGNTSNYGSRADSKTYRFYNEMMQIRYHFFDDMDAELFKEVFQEDFRDPDACSENELRCEQAFLIAKPFGSCKAPAALALVKFDELFQNPETEEILYTKYHYGTRQLGDLTGANVYYDILAEQNLEEKEKIEFTLREKNRHIIELHKYMEHQISDIWNQKSVLESRCKEKDQQIQNLEAEYKRQQAIIEELNQSLQTITNSKAWKMTKPFRKMKDSLGKK